MFKLFEVFGELSLKGAEAADQAMMGISNQAESLAGGIDKMAGKVGSAGSALTKGITGPAAAAAAGLSALAFRAVGVGDDMAKFSRSVGIGVEALQEIEFALGRVAGVSEGQTRKALEFLNRTLAEGTQGTASAIDSLEKLGFSQQEIADGAIGTEKALERVFEAIRNAGSEAEAQAIAMEVFGNRQGIALANNIREGAETIAEAREIAREQTSLMTQDQAEAAEAAADAWDLFKRSISSAMLQIGAATLPTFTRIIDKLQGDFIPVVVRGAERVAGLIDTFANLPPFVQKLISWVGLFVVALGPVLTIISRIMLLFSGLIKVLMRLRPVVAFLVPVFKLAAGVVAALGAPIAAIVAGLALLGTWLFINRQRVGEWAKALGRYVASAWEAFKGFGVNLVLAFSGWISGFANFAMESGRKLADWVKSGMDFFNQFKDGAISIINEMIKAIGRAIANMVTNVLGRFRDMVSGALDSLRRLYREAVGNSIIPDLARDVGRSISGMVDKAIDETSRMADGMERGMESIQGPELAMAPQRRYEGRGESQPRNIDLRHSIFNNDSTTDERLRRFGYDTFGGF